ncbi:ATP-binding cassette domain-containing protein [Lactobacillus sp. CC-MHH1034]|uniref:methionine ABC transporter ATP-binding protein n=1 Tax=Agrilactobacillus fermenti TaxID=2586909 RepID=UPI001E559A67|nr:ATP-binding cassette domain-containing protein [Agrilactobacillus fermenti]MCD2256702.1 ATP-binding cassette domain-containing protein [Agrilactobacillus fermenti]
MSQIEIKNVSVTFQNKKQRITAVSQVSIAIQKGEIFGIVGLTGAGKSTLVRTINGLQRPTTGEVIVDGINITRANKSTLTRARQKIGIIFQNFNLVQNRTLGENIAFALNAGGYPKRQQNKKITELLDLVDLADRKDNYPGQLSGGQKQRVGIARALANDPDILLCDEATSALDLETAEEIVAILKDINTRLHITIVFITHQLEVARSLFQRVAVMENGHIVEQATAYDLFANPRSAMGRRLVGRFLATALPSEIRQRLASVPGQLLALRYRGEDSLDPIITKIAGEIGVNVNIIQGRIEYVQAKAIGVLTVFVTGQAAQLLAAIKAFKQQVDQVEVVPL